MVSGFSAATCGPSNPTYKRSLAGDLRVTQTVDGNKGVHMLLAKRHL